METIRQRKIRAIRNKNKNIQQISYLLTSKFNAINLATIENTDKIFKLYKESVILHNQICGFLERKEYEKLVFDLEKYYTNKFFIISEYSFDSGLYLIDKLLDFNFTFNFADYGFYRVTLLMENLQGQISFFEENEEVIEICVSGELASESLVKLLKINKS